MEITRIKNDVNGNPRYVVHFLDCEPESWKDYKIDLHERYERTIALMRKKLGGKKFHNKQYGGGIVFQSYGDLEKDIEQAKNSVK